jgi:hypothetical protein
LALRRKTQGEAAALGDFVEWDGVALPRDFTATVSWTGAATFDVVARVHVDDNDGPQLVRVEFRAVAGLPLARLQKEFRWTWLRDHVVALYAIGGPGVDAQASVVKSMKRRSRRPKATDARHKRVADRYRSYPGRDVIRHIAAAEAVPYPTARRWVAEARDAGFLDPTTPGRRSPPAPAALRTKEKR